MKFLIGLAILVIVYLGAKSLMTYWGEVTSQKNGDQPPALEAEASPKPTVPAESLEGLPAHLESSLEAAKRQGAGGLRVWLKTHRASVRDPRLADIELDYAVMVAGKNYGEALEVIAAVEARLPEDSPVYPKLKKLKKAFPP